MFLNKYNPPSLRHLSVMTGIAFTYFGRVWSWRYKVGTQKVQILSTSKKSLGGRILTWHTINDNELPRRSHFS